MEYYLDLLFFLNLIVVCTGDFSKILGSGVGTVLYSSRLRKLFSIISSNRTLSLSAEILRPTYFITKSFVKFKHFGFILRPTIRGNFTNLIVIHKDFSSRITLNKREFLPVL